eukprot:scaffold791_cov115-Cylindrotheca_fusiformis.AAC.14
MSSSAIEVTVYSDLACPWCYVGKQRLNKAISQFRQEEEGKNKEIKVDWKPFMIDPATNPNGETVKDYCQRRWGGAGWTNSLKTEGKKDGADFGNWQWWPHTSKAHQLVQYCNENGVCSSDVVNESLFRAQYENGENISDVTTLVQIGKKLGLLEAKEDELTEYLTQDQGKAKVEQEINIGRRKYGISGVPFFVIGKDDASRPYGFSGAQKPDTFLDLFKELSE